jgi:hypothetical protein
MWRLSFLACVVCLPSALAQQSALVPMPRPHEGTITNGIYTNKYFDLSYPLPSGWTEAMAGPAPSPSGYYVLSTLTPMGGQFDSFAKVANLSTFALPGRRQTRFGAPPNGLDKIDQTSETANPKLASPPKRSRKFGAAPKRPSPESGAAPAHQAPRARRFRARPDFRPVD